MTKERSIAPESDSPLDVYAARRAASAALPAASRSPATARSSFATSACCVRAAPVKASSSWANEPDVEEHGADAVEEGGERRGGVLVPSLLRERAPESEARLVACRLELEGLLEALDGRVDPAQAELQLAEAHEPRGTRDRAGLARPCERATENARRGLGVTARRLAQSFEHRRVGRQRGGLDERALGPAGVAQLATHLRELEERGEARTRVGLGDDEPRKQGLRARSRRAGPRARGDRGSARGSCASTSSAARSSFSASAGRCSTRPRMLARPTSATSFSLRSVVRVTTSPSARSASSHVRCPM